MSNYKKGLKLLESKCGNNRDNVISLATISTQTNAMGQSIPAVRNVNAYYEAGVFYIVTYGKSNKMIEISKNNEVAFSVDQKNITGNGIAENLGWVLDPKNATIRKKLREVFSKWYDEANNEADVNFCYTAIHIKKVTVVTGHGPTTKRYMLDLENQLELDEIKEMIAREAYYFTFQGVDAKEKGKEYILELLHNNNIDLAKQKEPVYILGGYDVALKGSENFKYTLYLILPSETKLKENPQSKKIFGGYVARRFTTYGLLDESTENFYNLFSNHPLYDITSKDYIEQYLLDKNKFTNSTQVLQILPIKFR